MSLDVFFAELDQWAQERDPGAETHAYGSHPEQVADVRGRGERAAVLLHGGFWRAQYTRSIMGALAVDLALRGWRAWNVEYRRVGCGGGVPQTLDDVEAALQVIGADAVVIGHSAGGQLALCAAATGKAGAVVSLGGVTDLARAAREGLGSGAAVAFAGADPPPEADPMRQLPLPVPALLVHGELDDEVPVDYSRAFAAASGSELLELPRVGHYELIDPRSEAWKRAAVRLRPWLSERSETRGGQRSNA